MLITFYWRQICLEHKQTLQFAYPYFLSKFTGTQKVFFLTKSGLTKSYKGLIFISEKAWTPCIIEGYGGTENVVLPRRNGKLIPLHMVFIYACNCHDIVK